MKIITNSVRANNHKALINKLILTAEKIVISSGWMKEKGLQALIPSFEKALANNTEITIYSNFKHTEPQAIKTLKKYGNIKHVLAKKKTLHSKIYYFQQNSKFTALIGSANITEGGLIGSEELSIQISGDLKSSEHREIEKYLNELATKYSN